MQYQAMVVVRRVAGPLTRRSLTKGVNQQNAITARVRGPAIAPVRRRTQPAVLDPHQYLILRRDDHLAALGPPTRPRPPPGPALPAKRIDQPANPDTPNESPHVTTSPEGLRPPPHRQERVLHRLVNHLRRRAPPRQTNGQPAGMTVIQSAQRLLVTRRNGAQQRQVIGGITTHARSLPRAATPSLSPRKVRSVPRPAHFSTIAPRT